MAPLSRTSTSRTQVLELQKRPDVKPISSQTVDPTDLSTRPEYDDRKYDVYVPLCRFVMVTLCITGLRHVAWLQDIVDETYAYLLTTWLFNSVYFETLFTSLCYAIILAYPLLIDKLKVCDKYKIEPSVKYNHVTVLFILNEFVLYDTPLLFLDTFMVKKFTGVGIDPAIWVEKRKSILQTTRALPVDPPTVLAMVGHLVASLIVYDALFFTIHLVCHKNYYLYKYIHKYHHDHDTVHCHVTNQLTHVERICLVLSANFALKVFHSHPLTRMLFIPVFIAILTENHTGYDMPFAYHRIVPFGLVGGSVKHFQHHASGKRYYQPIFTYLDHLYEYFQRRIKSS